MIVTHYKENEIRPSGEVVYKIKRKMEGEDAPCLLSDLIYSDERERDAVLEVYGMVLNWKLDFKIGELIDVVPILPQANTRNPTALPPFGRRVLVRVRDDRLGRKYYWIAAKLLEDLRPGDVHGWEDDSGYIHELDSIDCWQELPE